MQIMPELEYKVKTKKTPQEIYNILSSITDSKRLAFSYPDGIEFVGRIEHFSFELCNICKWYAKNRCRPMIYGNIIEKKDITVVILKVCVEPLSRIVLTIWFCLLGLLFVFGIFYIFVNSLKGVIIPTGSCSFIILGQIRVRGAFYTPAKKMLQRLEELLI